MTKRASEQVVFVVDDEISIAQTLSAILRHEGFSSFSFNEPAAALLAAKEKLPDLLVTDMVMTGMTGFDLANSVRQACPHCKILLFSGQASFLDLLQRGNDGVIPIDSFLMKPVHPNVLLKKVAEMMNVN